MRIGYTTLAAGVVMTIVACGDATEPRVPTSVEVDQQAVTLEEGESVLVVATVLDQDGQAYDTPPEGFDITWSSSAPAIASVDDGEITGEGAGIATVAAQAGTLAPAEIQVTVEARMLSAQLGFSYSGDRSGSFSLEETFGIGEIGIGDWAVTFYAVIEDTDFTDAIGLQFRDDGLVDLIWFWVDGHITTTATRVAGAELWLGWDTTDNTFENIYLSTDGSVTHSSVTAMQMAGTFEFEMAEMTTEAGLSISGGTFDLPLVTEQDVFGDVADIDGPAAMVLPGSVRQFRPVGGR